jgi:hypothetical protein
MYRVVGGSGGGELCRAEGSDMRPKNQTMPLVEKLKNCGGF